MMKRALEREGVAHAVTEIFSPPRINGVAERLGIIKGISLDLTTTDPDDGKPWDFNDNAKRTKAMKMIKGKEAMLVVGSPMCKAFSQIQTMNKNKMGAEKWDQLQKEGRRHLEFCMELYTIQDVQGRYFLHEHPWGATSWNETKTKELMLRE